jgi:hypothetical protein
MTDFQPVKILDKRLNCHSDISYGVFEGGQNVNLQRFPAQSMTVNQHTYNIVTPNQNAIIDRRAYWRATIQFQLTGTTPTADGPNNSLYPSIVNYGVTDALAPFCLHSLCQTMQNTINSNTLSLNVADILPVLLRFYDPKDMEKYSSYTPTLNDNFGVYNADTMESNANPLSGVGNENYDLLKPRGSFQLDYLSWQSDPTLITYGASGNAFQSFNSGAMNGLPVGTVANLYGQVTVCEPILLSPWLVGNNKMNSQGFYGVENLSFTMNMVSNAKRFWRSGSSVPTGSGQIQLTQGPVVCTITGYPAASIDIIFLRPKPSLLLSSKNTVPLLVYERYITASNVGIVPCPVDSNNRVLPQVSPPLATLSSNNMVFNQIPDKIIVWVRQSLNSQTSATADFYLPIQGINIQWIYPTIPMGYEPRQWRTDRLGELARIRVF